MMTQEGQKKAFNMNYSVRLSETVEFPTNAISQLSDINLMNGFAERTQIQIPVGYEVVFYKTATLFYRDN